MKKSDNGLILAAAIGIGAFFLLKRKGAIGNLLGNGKITARAIIRDGDQFLLVQRAAHDIGGGQWQFVGGGVDSQVVHHDLIREVEEEVGLKAKNVQFFTRIYNQLTNTSTIYYTCKVSGNIRLQESELQDYAWVTLDEAKEMKLTPSTRSIIQFIESVEARAEKYTSVEFDYGL